MASPENASELFQKNGDGRSCLEMSLSAVILSAPAPPTMMEKEPLVPRSKAIQKPHAPNTVTFMRGPERSKMRSIVVAEPFETVFWIATFVMVENG